jgi:type III secretion system FlhB-like substrate exporter
MTKRRILGLEYKREEDEAPRISLKSSDVKLCAEILRLAKKHNVPVMERSSQVGALYSTPLDQVIPEKLYRVVAIILKTLEI